MRVLISASNHLRDTVFFNVRLLMLNNSISIPSYQGLSFNFCVFNGTCIHGIYILVRVLISASNHLRDTVFVNIRLLICSILLSLYCIQ